MTAPLPQPAAFWYLATPYSKYPHGIKAAFNLAVEARGLLLRAGVPCFSPIIHSHPVAIRCGIDPHDHSIWLPSEAPIMAAACGLIMLRAESWESSYGMEQERLIFKGSQRPVVYMDPGTVPDLPHPAASNGAIGSTPAAPARDA
jgi:Domain of unknown function (DUF1937)